MRAPHACPIAKPNCQDGKHIYSLRGYHTTFFSVQNELRFFFRANTSELNVLYVTIAFYECLCAGGVCYKDLLTVYVVRNQLRFRFPICLLSFLFFKQTKKQQL